MELFATRVYQMTLTENEFQALRALIVGKTKRQLQNILAKAVNEFPEFNDLDIANGADFLSGFQPTEPVDFESNGKP